MANLKREILAEMKRQKITTYRLAQLVKGKVKVGSVYTFLSGKSDLSGTGIGHLMKALGLKVVRNRRSK